MSRRHFASARTAPDGDDGFVARVRRLRARGELRKAVVTLRDACMRDESAVILWTLYGALEAKLGHEEDARRALKHAVWLRRSAGDALRARSTQALIERLSLPSAA